MQSGFYFTPNFEMSNSAFENRMSLMYDDVDHEMSPFRVNNN